MARFLRGYLQGAALLFLGLAWAGWPSQAQAAGSETEMSSPAARAGGAATPPTADAAGAYTYDPKSRRDPFQSLASLLKGDQARAELPPLQRVPLSDLKLQGIMWGAAGYYGSLRTPDGKGYTVKEGMRLGMNNGVISAITQHAVTVSEPSSDMMGNRITKEIEILLRPKEVSQ